MRTGRPHPFVLVPAPLLVSHRRFIAMTNEAPSNRHAWTDFSRWNFLPLKGEAGASWALRRTLRVGPTSRKDRHRFQKGALLVLIQHAHCLDELRVAHARAEI